MVLGHEGTGTVAEIGKSVTRFKVSVRYCTMFLRKESNAYFIAEIESDGGINITLVGIASSVLLEEKHSVLNERCTEWQISTKDHSPMPLSGRNHSFFAFPML